MMSISRYKRRVLLIFLAIVNVVFMIYLSIYGTSRLKEEASLLSEVSLFSDYFASGKIEVNITELMRLPQKCKIPKLDPYHPDFKPYMVTKSLTRCSYPELTRVTDDGFLQVVDTTKISYAKFAYMQRVDDNKVRYTEWKLLYNSTSKKGAMKVKIAEDFVKVAITSGGKEHIEFHMYPVRKEPHGEDSSARDPNKLNIAFIMMDSVSHSTAKRYLKKTMKKLKESKSSIIMNGHNIVGDGTTAQISAIFVGDLEHRLPEARRGFKGAGYVDKWPFTFKDFEKIGYKTLYSEDSPSVNTFNYRLLGFDKPPTFKYARNFWREADGYVQGLNKRSITCAHEINQNYLKRFLVNFRDQPSISYLVHSDLTHNNSPNAQLIDQDLVDLLKFLDDTKLSENTLIVFFGDHGDRSGGYRATMTGKLEERLPFMSFTFPPWFPEKFPEEFQHFKRNSDILTSHFDVHSTLRHLLTFPVNKHSHKYGKSLFTDILKLNRTCQDAGILEHWCSCLGYVEVKNTDSQVIKVANRIVESLNEKNAEVAKAKKKCATLKLKKIMRAGISAPSARVQKFKQTFKDGKCDECGVKEGETDFKTMNYEIVFVVSPSDGKYEASAVLHKDTGVISPGTEVSRINLYGNQPSCIAHEFPHLRPYCYCK